MCDQLMNGSFHTTQKPWSDFYFCSGGYKLEDAHHYSLS